MRLGHTLLLFNAFEIASLYFSFFELSGDYGGEVTPVPIPNTEVKLLSADGTPWETTWESRSLPELI